jgi:hypothetical protein
VLGCCRMPLSVAIVVPGRKSAFYWTPSNEMPITLCSNGWWSLLDIFHAWHEIPIRWCSNVMILSKRSWTEDTVSFYKQMVQGHNQKNEHLLAYMEVFHQLITQSVLLFLHVLAENHSHLQGATNVQDTYSMLCGCQLQMVKGLYILVWFINTLLHFY